MSSLVAPEVQRLLLRHAAEAGAFQILEPGYTWFVHGGVGCVGYVDTGGAWVAAGAPIAHASRQPEVARAFVAAAEAQGRRACFFGVEAPSAERLGVALLQLGQQPEWQPKHYAGRRLAPSLREQHRRARAKGVRVRAARDEELRQGTELDVGLRALTERWLATRRMETLGFVVSVQPADWRNGWGPREPPRVFVAERALEDSARRCTERRTDGGAELLAAAVLLPAAGKNGWFIKHLLRDPLAPNGTGELLVHELLLALAAEGSDYATLGLAPLAGDVHPTLRIARRTLRFAFDFEGLCRFKAKLAPSAWTPVYLGYPKGSHATLAVLDSLAAFAPGGRLRFALATARRKLSRWQPPSRQPWQLPPSPSAQGRGKACTPYSPSAQ